MKKRTKIIIGILTVPFILYVVIHTVIFVYYSGLLVYQAKQAKKGKVILLYKTNHEELLIACRQLYKEGYRGEYKLDDPHSRLDIQKFPKAILALQPVSIIISDERVSVGMMRGLSGFGVFAYPEHFVKPFEGYNIGHKELLNGLWYFDSGYESGREQEYEEYLLSLKPRE